MEILLSHYGTDMALIESLSQTDSQATKRAELWGFVKKWKHASFPIHTAIFLDVLGQIHHEYCFSTRGTWPCEKV